MARRFGPGYNPFKDPLVQLLLLWVALMVLIMLFAGLETTLGVTTAMAAPYSILGGGPPA